MNLEKIRLLVVDADPGANTDYQAALAKIDGVEMVGYARNKKTALEQVDSIEFDVALVDVMLTGLRSIDVIGYIATALPEAHILALTPSEVPHERVILALEAGALGFISKGATDSEVRQSIIQVHEGKPWLVPDDTLDVMRDSAQDMRVSVKDRRDRLVQILLGLVPITGLIAALVLLLWREYWAHIGVRVVDLGVDPTTRMTNVIISLLAFLAVIAPFFFIDDWIQVINSWITKKPALAKRIEQGRGLRLGKTPVGNVIFSHGMAWFLMAILMIFIFALILSWLPQQILLVFVGAFFAIVLLANVLNLQDHLPVILRLSQQQSGRSLAVVGVLLFLLFNFLGYEVLVTGPDLRVDGLHGRLAPIVLDLGANPVRLFDLDGNIEPIEVLYLGGNADLYVLYDPCTEETKMVPVGSSRVVVIDQVACPSP